MKKLALCVALCGMNLIAEDETPSYIGKLMTEKCSLECSFSDYRAKDTLIAVIDGKSYKIIQEKNPMSDAKLEVALGQDDVTFKGIIEGNTIKTEVIERFPDKKGFLGVASCVQNGVFTDCDLKKYHDGDTVMAVIEGKAYRLDKQNVSQTKIDHAIMQNNVGFFGVVDGDTFKLENMIYEGPEKGFFKGCV